MLRKRSIYVNSYSLYVWEMFRLGTGFPTSTGWLAKTNQEAYKFWTKCIILLIFHTYISIECAISWRSYVSPQPRCALITALNLEMAEAVGTRGRWWSGQQCSLQTWLRMTLRTMLSPTIWTTRFEIECHEGWEKKDFAASNDYWFFIAWIEVER